MCWVVVPIRSQAIEGGSAGPYRLHDAVHETRGVGELVAAEGLAGPDPTEADLRRHQRRAAHRRRFSRNQGILAGYWIIDVETTGRAYQIAAKRPPLLALACTLRMPSKSR